MQRSKKTMTATAEKPTCQYNEANDVKGVEK